jgi:hypothetical protein
MTPNDFQWLADRVASFFPCEEQKRAIDLLAQTQEQLEEVEAVQNSDRCPLNFTESFAAQNNK